MTRRRRTAIAALAAASLLAVTSSPAAAQEPAPPCDDTPECVDWVNSETWLLMHEIRNSDPDEYAQCVAYEVLTGRPCD